MWEWWIHHTKSGSPELPVPVSAASWTRRLGSKGDATHTIPVPGSGIPKSLIRELATGNTYTLAQRWGTFVASAGVIQGRRFVEASGLLTLRQKELRAALLGQRLPHGVGGYGPNGVSLTITGRSHSGAVRAIVDKAVQGNTTIGWDLPIDYPPDGAGGFSAVWRMEEGLTIEDMLTQMEEDGAEIDFAPYITPTGYLRWEVRVASRIQVGVPFLLAARAPGTIVADLETDEDFVRQRSGLLGFGGGSGQDRKWAWAGGGIAGMPVRDERISFPDITTQPRLQAAVDADYESRLTPTNQWKLTLFIGGTGPEIAEPGRVLDMHVFGSAFIEDGSHKQRVIAARGDASLMVTPEVQEVTGG
ncbi:hypothetical protein [Microbacterium sp.]|uniref:hypothetical protein n=1 Tax=Microbacterium sp. TaxID=51671 RepID=UPI003A931CFC